MTKNIKPFFLIIPLLLFFSCNDYDDNLAITPTNSTPNTPSETPLTNGTWKKEHYDTHHYENGVLTNISTNTTYADIEELDFNIDQSVIYKNPDYINPIHGTWSVNENYSQLMTTLNFQFPASTGAGVIYYFPNNKIIEVTENRLELESDTIFSTFNDGTTIIQAKEFIKYHFHH